MTTDDRAELRDVIAQAIFRVMFRHFDIPTRRWNEAPLSRDQSLDAADAVISVLAKSGVVVLDAEQVAAVRKAVAYVRAKHVERDTWSASAASDDIDMMKMADETRERALVLRDAITDDDLDALAAALRESQP